jgi:hypothetical protein
MPDGYDHDVNDPRAAGERIESLLAQLRARSGAEAAGVAEELVTCLVRLYGAGLAAVMRIAGDDDELLARLIADPLVESLLLVHDLHPLDPATRITRALGRVGGGAEFAGFDDAGVALVRPGSGCGSAAADIERAVTDAAPEAAGVRLVPREPPLLQISRRPAQAR